MKRKLILIIGLVVALFLLMGGCSIVKSQIARLTTDFNTLSSDNRILYENGAKEIAIEASHYLNRAITTIESKQYGRLTEPIKVYAFATPKSFSNFSGISEKARGASVGNEIYLSGLMKDLPDEVYGMIGHEMSHVQLTQQLGVLSFNRNLPRWFREGLAIYVSSGGGAPRNYEKETIAMFINGKHFKPETEGALFNRTLNSTADIGPRMFYSQSGMFVTYLANNSPLQFKGFLQGIQEGQKFEKQFLKSFGYSVNKVLESYISELPKA